MKTLTSAASHVLAVLVLVAASAAAAHEYRAGDIMIGHPYAFASIGKARTGAGYLSLKNTGTEADALIGVASEFADRNEVHTHISENGRMMMRPVVRLEIPAGETVLLEPGGYHLMLMGLKEKLKLDEKRPVTLYFERSGEITVDLSIVARKTGTDSHGGKHD